MVLSGVIGFGGSIFSLLISKWIAKRIPSALVIITQTETNMEKWLISTVENQARIVGAKMPEVAIFPDSAKNAFATGDNKNNALMAVTILNLVDLCLKGVRLNLCYFDFD